MRYMLVGGRVGLRNRMGENHCFLNVIVQSLFQLKTFSSKLMALDPYDLPGRQSSHAAWRLFKSLSALFHEFEATTCEAANTDSSPTLSPDGLRSALPSAFATEGGMHDADEVLHELFVGLLSAEVGAFSKDEDPLVPRLLTIPEAVATQMTSPRSPGGEKSWAQRLVLEDTPDAFSESVTLSTFGMRVQLPHPRAAPPEKVYVERFVRFFHHVYECKLTSNHELEMAADSPMSWSERVLAAGDEDIGAVPLLSRPSVVAIKVVWSTPVAVRSYIHEVCQTMAEADILDLTKIFTCVDEPALMQLRCAFHPPCLNCTCACVRARGVKR